MPLKLNVGISRKVGLPDYCSVGASCNLELELETALLEKDLEGFHARIRKAYAAAHQAVQDELARLQAPGTQAPTKPPARDAVNGSKAANGHARGNGEAVPAGRTAAEAPRSGKPATASQVNAIRAIARRHEADLDGLLHDEYGVSRPEKLTLAQASRVIDLLKATADA
jgi:hypothetical protein